ncbi:uracil-DNA glycosylase [Fredinandcohnia sp. SECRCQ15]|uniref:Uracil-DNA glycosylase n=1 Tax=Fredinandcohnia quinoae TaxID=2918902 RepID=A0AAW5DZT1_9BACI|nr:uracil-DNA glycosylase [Fredinandcohnia sp. SECRCQ15]MCH1626160.1 uracil-DNA glycosylase [Fredinandcohnia sp. SECRCQ15]
MDKRINCLKCKYFYTTWDPKFPRGCKAFNFKTHTMPSMTVQQSSGSPCMKFEEKKPSQQVKR